MTNQELETKLDAAMLEYFRAFMTVPSIMTFKSHATNFEVTSRLTMHPTDIANNALRMGDLTAALRVLVDTDKKNFNRATLAIVPAASSSALMNFAHGAVASARRTVAGLIR